MESDDDYELFSPVEELSSPIHKSKLKRLKKTVAVSSELTAQLVDPSPTNASYSTSDVQCGSSETLDFEKVDTIQPIFESEGFDNGGDSVKDPDGTVSDRDQTDSGGVVYVEEQARLDAWDEARDESDGQGEDRSKDLGEIGGVLNTDEAMNEQKYSDDEKKKKKKKGKSDGDDGKPEASARTKKRIEKERKINIERLHAETQRLLRETRDASFKPIPLVQKPISSVLEKIRKRKLEISKKASILNSYSEHDHSSRETVLDVFPIHAQKSERINDKSAEKMETGLSLTNEEDEHLEGTSVARSSDPASPSDQCLNISSNMMLDEESRITFRNPINDTQDLFCGSEPFDEEDMQPDSPLEEEFAPSLLAMNLKLDSAPPEEISSEEDDDNDKENVDPQPHKMVNGDIYPQGDPVKAFVDDEAEEEDDSDNDPMHSQENEEDEENGESEEFNDLIVSGNKEEPIDNEKRDQLHRKWLEQQDAAATENVLQRIKCGWKQKEATMFEEVDEDEEFDEDSVEEAALDLHPQSVVRINSKKVKQMIPEMFNDKDDVFVSDDEEAEQNLVRKHLLEKAEEQTTFLSPAEDESSREVFGLIKKLNVVPDTKRKAKSLSYLDKLITGGNSNSSSKSSFLGRVPNNSLPASNKHGSSNFRSFIFGRDDSNSKSGISASEVSPDVLQDEGRSQSRRNVSTKFSNSQSKISSRSTITSETSSGSSLLEILRRSAKCNQNLNNMVGQTHTVIQFAAFKSRPKKG